MKRETSAQRLLGAFTEALDVLDADPKLVQALGRVRNEVIPELHALAGRVDEFTDRLDSLKKKIQGNESDAEIVDEVVSDSEES